MEKLHRKSKLSAVTEPISVKPVLGLPLGAAKLTFRYADGSALELEGFLSDVTGLFLGSAIQNEFKDVVLEEINFLERSQEDKPIAETLNDGSGQESTDLAVAALNANNEEVKSKSAIQSAKMSFKNFEFANACRVLLLEENFNHQKHLILQIGRLAILSSYAYNIDSSQWSFVRGLKYDFLVDGSASTLPHKQRLRELGDVFLHIFIPEDHRANSKLDVVALSKAKPLLAIVPFIPQTVDVEQYLKAKDDIIDSKDDALKRARTDLSEKATRNDSGAISVSGFEEYNPENATTHTRFDFTDAILIAAPTVVAAVFGWSLAPTGWLGGFALGFPLGCFLVSRRK